MPIKCDRPTMNFLKNLPSKSKLHTYLIRYFSKATFTIAHELEFGEIDIIA